MSAVNPHIPFATLPELAFVNTDPDACRDAIITGFEQATGQTLYPGNPERLFLEGLAYVIAVLCHEVDHAGKQTTLAYAQGPHLDHKGLETDTPRLGHNPAVTTLRFSLQEPLTWDVEILGGTRVGTPDGRVTFGTDSFAVIEAGRVFTDVPATALTAGPEGNGLVAGQVNSPIDRIPYVVDARNVTTTAGGADEEDDHPYRLRIQGSREAYTCAGPYGSYEYHVLRVHKDIADAGIYTPVPGTVCICPIMRGGVMPPEDVLEAIRVAISADTMRPLTDTVIVRAPEEVEHTIVFGWYLNKRDSALAGGIGAAVAQAVEEYREWQQEEPGRDINPDELTARVKQAGAKRLVIDAPQFTKLAQYQIARITDVNVRYLGEEDE